MSEYIYWMYQYLFLEKDELKKNFTKLLGLRFDREILHEQCKLIDIEIHKVEINTASYLYLNWMKRINIVVDPDDSDDAIKLLVMDLFSKNKDKTLEFYDDIMNKFLNSSEFDSTIGKYELFRAFLFNLQNEMYESEELSANADNKESFGALHLASKQRLADLINELSEESNSEQSE